MTCFSGCAVDCFAGRERAAGINWKVPFWCARYPASGQSHQKCSRANPIGSILAWADGARWLLRCLQALAHRHVRPLAPGGKAPGLRRRRRGRASQESAVRARTCRAWEADVRDGIAVTVMTPARVMTPPRRLATSSLKDDLAEVGPADAVNSIELGQSFIQERVVGADQFEEGCGFQPSTSAKNRFPSRRIDANNLRSKCGNRGGSGEMSSRFSQLQPLSDKI